MLEAFLILNFLGICLKYYQIGKSSSLSSDPINSKTQLSYYLFRFPIVIYPLKLTGYGSPSHLFFVINPLKRTGGGFMVLEFGHSSDYELINKYKRNNDSSYFFGKYRLYRIINQSEQLENFFVVFERITTN